MGRPLLIRFLLLFYLVLYLLFPTQNSSLDAYYYGACIRYGNDLFLPHHLLYNATCYLLLLPLKLLAPQLDELTVLKMLNALFAAGSLWVLAKLLQRLQLPAGTQIGWIMLAGSSFGVWRFATENEVYLLPILLSLAGSYGWVKYVQQPKNAYLVWSGLFAALACLYHQLHVFWWLGLLLGLVWQFRSFKVVLLFGLPALLVPLVYVLVLVWYLGQALQVQRLLAFVLHDFYAGSAGTSIGVLNFVLSGVSFVRTFVQVHGLMLYLPGRSWWWLLPALVTVGLLVWAVLRQPLQKRKTASSESLLVGKVHLLILLLHLGFAWFAVGNVEFMVMVPFLLPLLPWLPFSGLFLQKTGAAFLIWNFWYGIFPAWHFQLSPSSHLVEIVHRHPESLFVLNEALLVRNAYYYRYGVKDVPRVQKSPSQLAARPAGTEELARTLEERLQAEPANGVLTDCIRKANVINRASIVSEDRDKAFFRPYHATPVDSFRTIYGTHYLHQLKPLPHGQAGQ
ncbi:hypothetical protein [Pontibacter beigongshangensis]|uniref:hypothetical protein n=1 Tax=Pontibacter beigongshangensis TaxID=2574733 RepID=UPI00164F0764|nr:hypothetical protein [Pontibacter beigongshangensis]